jgi:transketolase
MHTIKPLDKELVLQAAEETGKIVTVEEGYLAGGLGSCIAELLVKENPVPVKMIGVDDQYADAGPYEELLAHLGLQGEQIANTVEEFLSSN